MIVFDIETAALPDDELFARVPPFEPPPHPGEFDPASVKYGNLKDPVKRDQKLAEVYQAHQLAVANHSLICEQAKAEWEQSVRDKAALSPLTGRVLAIGAKSADRAKPSIIAADKDEAEALASFWNLYRRCREAGRSMVGFNCQAFDVPFLMRRSWLLGVSIPATLIERGRYVDGLTFIDLMMLWGAGSHDRVSLDLLAKSFGIAGKPTDENGEKVTGGMFATLWATNREAAIEYLTNDLLMTEQVAIRMGVV